MDQRKSGGDMGKIAKVSAASSSECRAHGRPVDDACESGAEGILDTQRASSSAPLGDSGMPAADCSSSSSSPAHCALAHSSADPPRLH
ncbi:protein O-mannosyl-transferase Tmtc3 isoform X1 [Ixodes scapularis]